jgi:hypothetical protein
MIKTDVEELERLSGITLPESLKLLLACNTAGTTFVSGSAGWRIFSLRELIQVVELRAVQGCRFCLAQMMASLYADKRGTSEIEDTLGEKHPVDHLARTITFAQGAGDFLYLNADDEFSVWVFYSDGGVIERIAPGLWDWISNCENKGAVPPANGGAFSSKALSIAIASGIRRHIGFLVDRGDLDEGLFRIKIGRTIAIRPDAAEVIDEIAKKLAEIHALDHETERTRRDRIQCELREFLQSRARQNGKGVAEERV